MEKLKRNGLTLLILILISLNGCYQENVLADYSDLYQDIFFEYKDHSGFKSKKLKYINIHCTASRGELSKEWLLNFFKNERKWSKPGYNLVVHMDGSIDTLVPFDNDGYVSYDEISYGVRGKNSQSINIAYTGGVDYKLKPKDTRTDRQKTSLRYVVENLKCKFPTAIIMGHRDHRVPKACPSFNVRKEYEDLITELDENVFENSIFENSIFDTAQDSL